MIWKSTYQFVLSAHASSYLRSFPWKSEWNVTCLPLLLVLFMCILSWKRHLDVSALGLGCRANFGSLLSLVALGLSAVAHGSSICSLSAGRTLGLLVCL